MSFNYKCTHKESKIQIHKGTYVRRTQVHMTLQ